VHSVAVQRRQPGVTVGGLDAVNVVGICVGIGVVEWSRGSKV
jgi:hypothetical protein